MVMPLTGECVGLRILLSLTDKWLERQGTPLWLIISGKVKFTNFNSSSELSACAAEDPVVRGSIYWLVLVYWAFLYFLAQKLGLINTWSSFLIVSPAHSVVEWLNTSHTDGKSCPQFSVLKGKNPLLYTISQLFLCMMLVSFLSWSHNAWDIQHIGSRYMLAHSSRTPVHNQFTLFFFLHLCPGAVIGEACDRTIISCSQKLRKRGRVKNQDPRIPLKDAP